MKFGICNETFKAWSFDETLKYVSSLGYDGIEIAPFTLAESVQEISSNEREKIRSSAGQNGLEIIGLHWLLASPEGLVLSSPDKKVRQKAASYLKELVGFCGDLGGTIMVFGSPKQRSILSGCTYEDTWDYLKEGFLDVLPAAQERNVTIALEPLARAETNIIATAGEAIEMITQINHPNFRLHLDVNAMSDEEKPIPEIIASAGDYVVHFHANDPNHLGPGFGEVRYEPIKEALDGIGYNGYISVEVFDLSPGAESIAEKSIQYLRKIFGPGRRENGQGENRSDRYRGDGIRSL